MKMQSDKLHILHLQSHFYHMIHVLHTNAKLVFRQSGSDIGMSMSSYIRIDAESDISHFTFSCSQFIDNLQLRNRLYIKTENIIVQTQIYFPIRLAHSGKNNLICRKTCLNSSTHFSSTHTIGTQPVLTDNRKHLRISICFHSIMHLKIAIFSSFCTHAGKSVAQHLRIIIIKGGTQFTEFIYGKCSFHTSKPY